MAKVVPILSTPKSLLRSIREIVKDSSKVSFAPAMEKGIAGDVAMSQVWKCLEEGNLTDDPKIDEYGYYLCELNTITAGQNVYLTVAVDTRDVTNQTIIVLHISEG